MRAGLKTVEVWRRAARFLLASLPAIYLLSLVNKYGVNVPFADDFTLAPLLVKANAHAVTWWDLFGQHNEHRYFFPRLIIIAFARVTRGDLRAEMFFSVFLTALVSVNLWLLVRKTLSASVTQSVVLIFLVNLLLFSPVQAENWTWGFQFPVFLCNFFFTCAVLAAVSNLHIANKFAVCVSLAGLATFSFGSGVVNWALTFPLALLLRAEMTWKSRIAWGLAWGAAGLGAVTLYLFHYVSPPHHPSLVGSTNPADYFLYVTTFLGAQLSRASRNEPIFQAAIIGTVLLTAWCGGVVYAIRNRRNADLRKRLLPWLALGGYAVVNAVLVAGARIGFGVNQALDSRYTSFSLFLGIAVIGLLFIFRQRVQFASDARRFERLVMRLETVLLTAFAVFSLSSFSWGRSSMMDNHRTRLLGKGALLLTNVMDSGEVHERNLLANAPDGRRFANMLDQIGLFHPRMLQSAEIAKLKWTDKEGEAGFLDAITQSGTSCSVVGWALLPTDRTPAYCVVLSYDDPQRGPVLFRMADGFFNRSDVMAARHNAAAEASGWSCHFDRSLLPPGEVLLTAWAFDANRAVLYRLGTPKILP